MNFYDLNTKTPQGNIINMADYKGKVVLIVNTATKCGFTPQLGGLQELHEKYSDQGLVVLGFPCNQFGEQEPESNETMVETCQINYGVTFQLTEKVDVNGENAHPVFQFLKNSLSGWLGKKIRWNFTKFLIDSEGVPYKRYGSTTKPEKLEKDVQKLLQRKK